MLLMQMLNSHINVEIITYAFVQVKMRRVRISLLCIFNHHARLPRPLCKDHKRIHSGTYEFIVKLIGLRMESRSVFPVFLQYTIVPALTFAPSLRRLWMILH